MALNHMHETRKLNLGYDHPTVVRGCDKLMQQFCLLFPAHLKVANRIPPEHVYDMVRIH
jgi:hypothetical protein